MAGGETPGTRGTRMDGASKKDTDEPFVVRHPQECIHEDQGRPLGLSGNLGRT